MADLGLLAQLRREPDVEAPDLVAVDATDRLLLDEAADLLPAAGPGAVAVVDDSYGALTLGAVAAGARDVRVHQDLLVGELALARNAERTGLTGTYRSLPLGPGLADGARLVLAKAPKSLDALRELTEVVASSAAPRTSRRPIWSPSMPPTGCCSTRRPICWSPAGPARSPSSTTATAP